MELDDNLLKQFMVEFLIPQPVDGELLELIPVQREAVDELFACGKLLSYSLSQDRKKVWAIMLSESESELVSYIESLPMTAFMDYDYRELMFHNTVHLIPSMSLN